MMQHEQHTGLVEGEGMPPSRQGRAGTSNLMIRTAAGRTLAASEAGAGRDVLLIHGTLTTADDMRLALFDGLQDAFRVVAIDRPSRGLSDRVPLADASLWSQAATIRDAAHALGLRRPIVVGHSYGGAVAVAMAIAYPELVSGVVALAPVCFPEPRLEHLLFGVRVGPGGRLAAKVDPLLLPVLWNAMFLPHMMPPHFAAAFPFSLAGRVEQTIAEGESANCLGTDLFRSMAGYASCGVPIRFLAGSADIVVNPLHSTMAAALIPKARLMIMPGVGHMLHHTHASHVVAAIEALARATT